ncbi:hypothetical protein QFZ27_007816 [Inquilinus ginsengisoli]
MIQRAVWMYLRFTLSYRDVEDLLAERGIEVTYETIRRWVSRFGPIIARRLCAKRPAPHRRWHLDEMFVRIGGKPMYLWRAVDAEGEVLEVLVQARRDAAAARKPQCWQTWRLASRSRWNSIASQFGHFVHRSSGVFGRDETRARSFGRM